MLRRRALLAGLAVPAALLTLVPVAEGQTRRGTDLRVSNTTGIPSTVAPGGAFSVRTTVANRGERRALAPKVFLGLTRGTRASASASRVATRTLPAFRSGRSTRYSITVRLSARRTGSYRLVLCVTQRGRKARCVLGRRVTIARATPPPAPTPTPTPAPAALDEQLRAAITPAALTTHTNALADIATANGNRAAGTQGYDDSAAYVINRMANAGYGARIDRFDFVQFAESAPPVFTSSVGTYATPADYASMEYSGSGDSATKPIVPIDLGPTPTPDTAPASSNTSGCEAADYTGFTAGSIALVKRGTCSFGEKAAAAAAAGASALIIMNEGQPGREETLSGTLGAPVTGGEAMPVIGTSAAVGEALAAATPPAGRVATTSTNTPSSSYNLLFDTPGGDAARTIVIGAHLDSVPAGPGINDNGSGTAFVLALAEQMKALNITPRNKVRFAFWGAEEAGLVGSTAYVAGLPAAELDQIALNLNFDMLASPNYARLVYDGNFSDTPPPAGAPLAPGSADIESAFLAFFAARGQATRPTAFDGRSDYQAFQSAGLPAGGLFSGAEEIKAAGEVPLFGGTAGVAYDVNYHQPGDGRANLNLTGFKELADGAATVALGYASAEALPAKAPTPRSVRGALARAASSAEWLGGHLQR